LTFGDFLYYTGFHVEYTAVRVGRGLAALAHGAARALLTLLAVVLRPAVRAADSFKAALTHPRQLAGYAVPLLAAGVLAWFVRTALARPFVLRVEVGGQVVGYVTDEQAFDAARADVQARLTGVVGWNVQPAYTLVMADADTRPMTERETAERDAQRAEALAGTAEHGGKPYFWIAALVLAALCAVLGYLVAQPLYYAAIAFAVLTVVLLVVARSGKKRAQEASAALGKLLRSYGAQDADGIYYQAEVHRAAYRACAAAMQAEQKAAAALEDAREHQCETHERLLQSLDFESGTGEAAALYQRKCALESVCTRLRTQQAQLTGAALAIGDPMVLGSEHAQLLEQRDALERQYAAIALAIETLGRADAELQSRFSPQLAQKAADYMDYLTDGRYDELVLARDLSAKARSADDPTPRDTAYLSAGTADLLYLSVRLALCELTCPADDPCPLVLDDTLVNFDDARAKRAMALFHEIAQHRQVILFTCHERDCPAQG